MLFIGSTLTRTRYISLVFYISTNTMGRKTIESHCEHIKAKLGYANAEALKRGARELLGTTQTQPQNPC
jgi:Tfp pilus assembly protein FimT